MTSHWQLGIMYFQITLQKHFSEGRGLGGENHQMTDKGRTRSNSKVHRLEGRAQEEAAGSEGELGRPCQLA